LLDELHRLSSLAKTLKPGVVDVISPLLPIPIGPDEKRLLEAFVASEKSKADPSPILGSSRGPEPGFFGSRRVIYGNYKLIVI
jgi:hypothetical protein